MKCAIFDLDGTLIKSSSERLFLKYLTQKRIITFKQVWATIKFLIKNIYRLNKGLIKSMRSYYTGISVKEFETLSKEWFNTNAQDYVIKATFTELNKRKDEGYRIILLTGSSTPLAKLWGNYFQADEIISTGLESREGVLTGNKLDNHVYSKKKFELLIQKYNNIEFEKSYAYGDNFTDRHLLNHFKHPVAVNPDFLLKMYANFKGWSIIEL